MGTDPGGQGAAWHSDDDPTPAADQSWSDYRGYRKVLVHEGTGATRTTDEYRYLRGMDGDHLADGSRRAVTQYTSDSADGDTKRQPYVDFPWLGGELIEHRTLRADGSEVSSEQHDWSSFVVNDGSGGPFGIHHHQVVQVGDSYDMTMVTEGGTVRARKHATYRSFEHGVGPADLGGRRRRQPHRDLFLRLHRLRGVERGLGYLGPEFESLDHRRPPPATVPRRRMLG